jgi:hypothetical protein
MRKLVSKAKLALALVLTLAGAAASGTAPPGMATAQGRRLPALPGRVRT